MMFFIGDKGKLIISKLLKGENLEFLLFFPSTSFFRFTSSQYTHVFENKTYWSHYIITYDMIAE